MSINVTAQSKDASLPHMFNVTVVEILQPLFILNLERVDKSEGWAETEILFEWNLTYGEGIVFRHQYIWLPFASENVMFDRQGSFDECKKTGGSLVDIADKETFDVICNYVKNTLHSGNNIYINMWTGMTFNPTTYEIIQSNGEPGYNESWRQDPNTDRYSFGVRMFVTTQVNSLNGFRNRKFTTLASPLCSSPLNVALNVMD
nr:uncharacterized protein LOC108949691 isoform X2 [Ciona intestinalis]|eukprot:XP_018668424.1 uncharacterized protein LOC108949691 isoform X2 [Ciona intestinalis]